MTLARLKELRDLGLGESFIGIAEYETLLDLAEATLTQRAKAKERVDAHRRRVAGKRKKRGEMSLAAAILSLPESKAATKDGKPAPLSGPGVSGDDVVGGPKASQNGRKAARRPVPAKKEYFRGTPPNAQTWDPGTLPKGTVSILTDPDLARHLHPQFKPTSPQASRSTRAGRK